MFVTIVTAHFSHFDHLAFFRENCIAFQTIPSQKGASFDCDHDRL